MPNTIPQATFTADQASSRRQRFWASIVSIALGNGFVIGVAIGQASLILFLGWGLLVAGYSLNIVVQRETAKESP